MEVNSVISSNMVHESDNDVKAFDNTVATVRGDTASLCDGFCSGCKQQQQQVFLFNSQGVDMFV
ncbi:hypothetical protein DOY81_001916 [Sarcophaga bullata]|nr:hypothetical protein DOY81_001916 [Sarcophaga bullata]